VDKVLYEMIADLKEKNIEIVGMTFPEIFELWKKECCNNE
jgi:hypothetical protein